MVWVGFVWDVVVCKIWEIVRVDRMDAPSVGVSGTVSEYRRLRSTLAAASATQTSGKKDEEKGTMGK